MSTYTEVFASVEFILRADKLDALRAHAREVDDQNQGEHAETYTDAQALQVVWHEDPAWVHDNVLAGWVITDDVGWSTVTMVPEGGE